MKLVALELLAAALFIVTMLRAAAVGQDEVPDSHLRLLAWHHEYLGWVVFLASFAAPRGWRRVVVQLLALVITWDDTLQHAVQHIMGNLDWRSPLHHLWALAWHRWSWVRVLSGWFGV